MWKKNSLFVAIFSLFFVVSVVHAIDDTKISITGRIVSCQGWALNKRPELKKFVKFGGADCFENVQVEFQHGQKAVLTIYHNGQEMEQVELQSMPTAKEMHDMMLAKGFRLKAPEEVARIQSEGDAAFQKEMEAKQKRQQRARQKMENLKTPSSKGVGLNTESATATIQKALQKMKENGVAITADTIRKLEQEHNQGVKVERDENIDALSDKEQISNEQMKQWKLQQWRRLQEEKKLAASAAGDEL